MEVLSSRNIMQRSSAIELIYKYKVGTGVVIGDCQQKEYIQNFSNKHIEIDSFTKV